MGDRQKRIAVFEGTRQICLQDAFLKNAIGASRRNQRIYWEGNPIEYKENNITFQCKPDGTAEVAHCAGWYGDRIIPKTVAGYRVTAIGANAFPGGSCRSLFIPDSVTEIQSLPVDFTEKVWDRPRFGMRENAMDIDEPVLVERTYSVTIYVQPNSYAERYCKEKKIRYLVK